MSKRTRSDLIALMDVMQRWLGDEIERLEQRIEMLRQQLAETEAWLAGKDRKSK